jgi:hypothetical protein
MVAGIGVWVRVKMNTFGKVVSVLFIYGSLLFTLWLSGSLFKPIAELSSSSFFTAGLQLLLAHWMLSD